MGRFFLVCLGGAIGTGARYLIATTVPRLLGSSFPYATLVVNVIGSFCLGAIMHAEGNYSHDWLANYPADSWRMAAEESRAGGMTGMGIHVLDCFRDLVGPMKVMPCSVTISANLAFSERKP